MVKMKVNIRFLINELPVLDILFKKDLEADNICDMCDSSVIQTVDHVLANCRNIINDSRIIKIWSNILDILKKIFVTNDPVKITTYLLII